MDIDDVFREIGEFGSYQRKVFSSCAVLHILAASHMIHKVFIGATPSFYCSEHPSANPCAVPCQKYVFNGTFTSIVSEWSLVCKDAYKPDMMQSIFMGGVLLGAVIFGSLSDRYGRLRTLYAAIAGLTVFSMTAILSVDYTMYVILRFCAGVFCGGMILVSFVLGSEVVGSSYRALCGTLIPAVFAGGIMLFAGLAYVTPSWRVLTAVVSLPGLLCVVFCWYMPESPRWLLSQGRHGDAERALEDIARANGEQLRGAIKLKEVSVRSARSHGLADLFKHAVLRRRTAVQVYAWFVNSGVYYGITLAAGDLGSNLYASVALSGLVELPAYASTVYLLQRFGRKFPFCAFMLVGGVSCIAILLTPTAQTGVITGLALVGKLSISASFAVAYIYSAELYPTVIRNNGMGVCSMAARVGGIVSPMIVPLGSVYPGLHFLVFGVLAFTAGVISLQLPETLDQPIPETLEDLSEATADGPVVELSALADDKVRLLEGEIREREEAEAEEEEDVEKGLSAPLTSRI